MKTIKNKVYFFSHPLQMLYQRSWLSPSTGTSTTRSTWSLQWPACFSLQSCTAVQEAWSSAAMLSNRYWDTTLSFRPWHRRVFTSPTRTDWSPREIWPAHQYTWWVELFHSFKKWVGTPFSFFYWILKQKKSIYSEPHFPFAYFSPTPNILVFLFSLLVYIG